MPGFPAVEETIMQTVITINAVIMALFSYAIPISSFMWRWRC